MNSGNKNQHMFLCAQKNEWVWRRVPTAPVCTPKLTRNWDLMIISLLQVWLCWFNYGKPFQKTWHGFYKSRGLYEIHFTMLGVRSTSRCLFVSGHNLYLFCLFTLWSMSWVSRLITCLVYYPWSRFSLNTLGTSTSFVLTCVCVCARQEDEVPELEIDVDELLDLPSDVERAIRVKVFTLFWLESSLTVLRLFIYILIFIWHFSLFHMKIRNQTPILKHVIAGCWVSFNCFILRSQGLDGWQI